MLQHVAGYCNVLQYVAVCCIVLQCVAACCSVLQHVAVSVNSHSPLSIELTFENSHPSLCCIISLLHHFARTSLIKFLKSQLYDYFSKVSSVVISHSPWSIALTFEKSHQCTGCVASRAPPSISLSIGGPPLRMCIVSMARVQDPTTGVFRISECLVCSTTLYSMCIRTPYCSSRMCIRTPYRSFLGPGPQNVPQRCVLDVRNCYVSPA